MGKVKNRARCENGHFYDADRFPCCPICSADAVEIIKNAEKEPVEVPFRTKPLLHEVEAEHVCEGEHDAATKGSNTAKPAGKLPSESEDCPEEKNEINKMCRGEEIDAEREEETSAGQSLSIAVEETSSKTVSVLPKTAAYYNFDEVEPPVGWLVCIKGIYQGKTFECRVGRNRVGRRYDLELSLTEDVSITREPHVILIYEPKQRKFFVQAGMSDGLAYLNGELLFAHAELHAYDRIALGKSEFVFVPLCGDRFSWDELHS